MPAVSGRFYPASPRDLARMVRELLASVPDPKPRAVRGAVVPHAGYVYSGFTAACVFAHLVVPPVVVIVAPNHTGRSGSEGGAALWEAGVFRTPLGDVTVDRELAERLRRASPLVQPDHEAHQAEHAVEVVLPFLQALRPDVRIVPLVLAWAGWAPCRDLGQALAGVAREWPEPLLVVASSDLNHYEPAPVSEAKDRAALAALEAVDGEALLERCRADRISMCGRGPAAAVAVAARALGATRGTVVDYRHSGWVTGDASAVVGYGGVLLT